MFQRLQLILAWFTRFNFRLKWLAVYMSIVGLVTFPLFIHEEALQTIMFGTWQAAAADRYDIIANGANMMEKINRSMKTINYVFGWVNPLSFMSYGAYGNATDFYIEASRAKIMRKAPHLVTGVEVRVDFKPSKIERLIDGRWLGIDASNIGVIFNNEPKLNQTIRIEGIYEMLDGRLVIKENA
jgi:hypothetical protein